MFKKIALAVVTSVAIAGTSSSVMAAPESAQSVIQPTVAVINLPFIMSEIPQAKASRDALAKEFGPRIQEIEALRQEGQKLGEQLQSGQLKGNEAVDANRRLAQMQSDFNLKARALQEDQGRRASEEQVKLTTEVQKAIDAIAKERGIQLVLRETAIAYTVSALDISKDVIERVGSSSKKTN